MTRLFLVLAVLLLGTAAPAAAATNGIDAYVRAYLDHTGLPGAAVAVTHNGDVVRVAGYGHDADGAPLTASTRLPVASLSKSMTAFAVLQLVEQGRLGLDEPVTRYLPGFRLADERGARITVRMLLDQTSGMADSAFPDLRLSQPHTLAEAVDRLRDAPLASEPGAEFHYHNPNYEVAARIVEVVAGQPFADHLRTRLFAPLGMASSTTVDGPPAGTAGYVRAFGFEVPVAEPDWFTGGSHGVVTTAEDLAKWLAAQRDGGGALSPESAALAHTPAPGRDYALGWRVRDGLVSHTGEWFSHTAAQILLPDGYGIAVVTTMGMALDNEAELLARDIATLVQGGSPEPALPAGVLADRVLAALALIAVGLAVVGVRRARRKLRWWRVVPPLLPLVPLAFLPQLLGVVFAGRRGTYGQVLYVWPGLVAALAVLALAGLTVAVARARALVSGTRARNPEESGETRGDAQWASANRRSGS
ncbi:Beta-lactamase class C-like and penicillin binding proteins (PBPs) superfamily [Amycolatopsis camponoti]|uniref:Beta-lactamase class C-like and penicillin binding proteins (PBPs) superfamily n=1 Tax=Amycolatopsis camponoti TaxID=2606593 RepID=A0A6I8LUU0_9PSEU|nr:serine hydrolase domain-containing protein [Amycolatopsis camponoti]VVJ19365.1 Beta-lactamase class C-like and penicillin binding proteins (PBPs) superfamily [Amycolatopsis camponoti]